MTHGPCFLREHEDLGHPPPKHGPGRSSSALTSSELPSQGPLPYLTLVLPRGPEERQHSPWSPSVPSCR